MGGAIVAAIALLAPLPSAGVTVGAENLFFIQRSKNRNEVHYDANIEGCRWSDPPVLSYWRDLEEGPDVLSKIRWWEGPACGFDVERFSDTRIEIRLKALDTRVITAELVPDGQGCRIDVTTTIGSERAHLRYVYVHTTEGVFLLDVTVDAIDLHGYADDGRPVVERRRFSSS